MNISRGIGYKNNILRVTKVNFEFTEQGVHLVALFINCGDIKLDDKYFKFSKKNI